MNTTPATATWDELDSNQPCPTCGCIDNGHSCESVITAIASVEEIQVKTPEQQIMAALADGCIITTVMEDGCVIACCENGIPYFDATVIGRRGDSASVVMADAVTQHKANISALINS